MIPQGVKYVGFPWFEKKNFKKLMKLFVDNHLLHDSYGEWLENAEHAYNSLKEKGITVDKVNIDPKTFPSWCKSRGLDIDAKARMEFANEFVARKHLGK
ncbi:hypothetical protein [Desulfobacula phenolica]|uniref:hypothetical protein n=1 Tax=Desulfobacula phenolica TaxID=90732 RepID=UPI000B852464|nr:hypothetical protein [Desulfobacula phenolica]